MIKQLDYSFLRNPVWILAAFVAIIIPDFLVACQFELTSSLGFLASDTLACTQGLTSDVFMGHSVLSFFMVIIVFETLRLLRGPFKLQKIPDTFSSLAGFQFKTVIGLMLGLGSYALVTAILFWTQEAITTHNFIQPRLPLFEFNRALVVGFVLINGQLLYAHYLNKRNAFNSYINVDGAFGPTSIKLDTVDWFEKEGRNYFAHVDGSKYKISLHLQALEKRLNSKKFMRINRAVIINYRIILDYSHWENEKYILRTSKNREFVVSRKRINLLKQNINHSDE